MEWLFVWFVENSYKYICISKQNAFQAWRKHIKSNICVFFMNGWHFSNQFIGLCLSKKMFYYNVHVRIDKIDTPQRSATQHWVGILAQITRVTLHVWMNIIVFWMHWIASNKFLNKFVIFAGIPSVNGARIWFACACAYDNTWSTLI